MGFATRQGRVDKTDFEQRSPISFDLTIEVVEATSGGRFRLRSAAVEGGPGGRFVYLRIGTYAGQKDTSYSRRAKIGLEGISRNLVVAVKAKRSGVLEAQFAGTDRHGGPACAKGALLRDGWRIA